jgi:hypothetical protein
VVLVALFVLNFGYLFEGTFDLLGQHRFLSNALGGQENGAHGTGNRFRGTFLGAIPMPFPKQYLMGIDYLRFETERRYWSFLDGEWRLGSWWYYYLATIVYKTPAALLGMMFCSIVGQGYWWHHHERDTLIHCLAVPSIVAFFAISSQLGFGHHHRYVLFIYPLLFVKIARMVTAFDESGQRIRRIGFFVVWPLLIAAVFEGLFQFPHFIGHFNWALGGSEKGYTHLNCSNVDWGQEHLLVQNWIRSHPDRKPVFADPSYPVMNAEIFGPEVKSIPTQDQLSTNMPAEGWYIVSKINLAGNPAYPHYSWLTRYQPCEEISNSYYVYHLTVTENATSE